jgi:hypothetical protein
MTFRPLFVAIATIWVGCSSTSNAPAESPASDASVGDARVSPSADASATPFVLEKKIYVSFILNVHDWVYGDESITTMNRVVDLHEKYNVPIDIYLMDPMVQLYETKAPSLLTRLKTSPLVAVSYHLRVPYPYYANFDWMGLANMSDAALSSTILNYEEHKLDLVSGQATSAPGGYQHLKDILGYAPYTVVTETGNKRNETAMAAIYKAKGAFFTLVHGRTTELGQKAYDLTLRPEHVEVKAYENPSAIAVDTAIMDPAIASAPATRPAFVNLKWHDDNFHSRKTPWINVFYADSEAKQQPRLPPFDLSAIGDIGLKTESEKAIQWDRYEKLLQYVVAHTELGTMNSHMLKSALSQ